LNRFFIAVPGVLWAAAAVAQQQPNWKNQGEYDLYTSISQAQNDPSKQLQLLNTWKEKYPDSEFKVVRADLFAKDYLALNQPAQAITAAQEALSVNPKDVTALVDILRAAPYVQPVTADLEKAGENAAGMVINDWSSCKPATVSDADWTKAKGEVEPLAQYTLAWSKVMQKDYAASEKPLRALLATSGNALVSYGLATYWLGTALYMQHKVPDGLYEIARSVSYAGPGALDEATRGKAAAFLANAYEGYHGDQSGLPELKQLAVKTPFPPDGFSIKSVKDVEDEKQAASAGFAAQHPDIALWRLIRTTLQGDGGPGYFDQNMKAAQLPPPTGDFKQFKAKVVSMPNPKEILVSVDDPAGDATLAFSAPLRGKIEPGLELQFTGVVESYSKEPFNVRFTVERKDVNGLPAAGPVPAHKAVTKR
jgi:tetratricopeptide (TPR) repeat protein